MIQALNVIDDYKKLCAAVAAEILNLSAESIASSGRFTFVLAGGSTPKGIYECMAAPGYADRFQWDKIHIFWGDERSVSPEDARSNFCMAARALLDKIKIPAENVHPIPTRNMDAAASAARYEGDLCKFFHLNKGQWPGFDLVLLGLGEDGHTASLFPGNPSLSVKDHLVVPAFQPGVPEPRITLSLPVINQAQRVFFVASGKPKADIVYKILHEDGPLPAQQINPVQGKIYWFLDQEAAGKLPGLPKRLGLAADHGGWALKRELTGQLRAAGYEVVDFGNDHLESTDDYPDFVVPLAQAVARGDLDRGIAICGSGVGACIAANKVAGARACMIHEEFSARQGVEDDDMNIICLGSKVLDEGRAMELIRIFLSSRFSFASRHRRRLAKIAAQEQKMGTL